MVLMFLRELNEQQHLYPHYAQTYSCPMMKCYAKFTEPFPLIQHLLACPELPNGEFDCDKCSNWHEFPTNEKDWSLWSGWSGKSSQRPNSQVPAQHSDIIERKRSFSSKVRDHFSLRKKDARKTSMDNHAFPSRPGTAASGASSIMTMSRCPEHHPMVFPTHGSGPSFAELQKPTTSPGAPQIENTIFWPNLRGDDPMSDLQSAVSSIAPSSNFDTDTTKGLSTNNTSQTTLFNNGLGPYQSASSDVLTSPFIFTPQPAFDDGSTSLAEHSSAMSIDERIPMSEATLSPPNPATPSDNRTWWGEKLDINGPRPTPIASPYYGMDEPMAHHLSRTMSQESMQTSMPGLFERGMSEVSQMDAMSPHSEHIHTHQSMGGRSSPTDDLVCDECQWKPRGVRENLRGYLRKHKNTHKGLRLPCDVPGCTKTFSRLDNLKKHKKDKHGIDDPPGTILPMKRGAEEYAEHIEEEGATPTSEIRRQPTVTHITDADIRNAQDYSMLWPALHF